MTIDDVFGTWGTCEGCSKDEVQIIDSDRDLCGPCSEWLGEQDEEPSDDFLSDVEADADALRSCGFGTDEDYGDYGTDAFAAFEGEDFEYWG